MGLHITHCSSKQLQIRLQYLRTGWTHGSSFNWFITASYWTNRRVAIAQVVGCVHVTQRPRVQSSVCVGEACGGLFLTLQHWRLCISCGLHAWPRKWRSRLTDLEWDVKEPQAPWQWPPSVSPTYTHRCSLYVVRHGHLVSDGRWCRLVSDEVWMWEHLLSVMTPGKIRWYIQQGIVNKQGLNKKKN